MKRKTLLLFGAAIAGATAAPIAAQQAATAVAEEDQSALREIIVTAQRRADSVQSLPVETDLLIRAQAVGTAFDDDVPRGLAERPRESPVRPLRPDFVAP